MECVAMTYSPPDSLNIVHCMDGRSAPWEVINAHNGDAIAWFVSQDEAMRFLYIRPFIASGCTPMAVPPKWQHLFE